MKQQYNLLAYDIGASGGRLLHICYDQKDGITTKELHRFSHGAVLMGGSLVWNLVSLYENLIIGLCEAKNRGIVADSLGIDSFCNDFALLDATGALLEHPVCYRDRRTLGLPEQVQELVPDWTLYERSGVQLARFNTLYQLVALRQERPHTLAAAKAMLLIPDLLTYFLTGVMSTEYTLASVSGLYSYQSGSWDRALIKTLQLPNGIFTPILPTGGCKGYLLETVSRRYNLSRLWVTAVCGHDTASAVAAVPTTEESPLYISSGTWSIVGTELSQPLLSKEGLRLRFANEGSIGGRVRFSKNVMGLWIIQELRKSLGRQGLSYSFLDLEELAAAAPPCQYWIDPDDPRFFEPEDMHSAFLEAITEQQGRAPESLGGLMRVVYESLAMRYRLVIDELESLVAKRFSVLHILGGGAKDAFLCQLTANLTGKTVEAGPTDATALGNGVGQLLALGAVNTVQEARALIRESGSLSRFLPKEREFWEARYQSVLSQQSL